MNPDNTMGRVFAIALVAVIVIFGIIWILGLNRSPAAVVEPNPIENENPTTTPATLSYVNADATKIRILSPLPGSIVPPNFALTGEARGPWFFEASFPIEIVDPNGTRILMMPVQAGAEWMTTEFVPFSTQVSVPGYRGPATLILHRDNASGLPEHDARVSFPIIIQ